MIKSNDAVFIIVDKSDMMDHNKMQDIYFTCEVVSRAGGKPRHQLMFHGYNDDPRPVYHIPECVAVCQRIMLDIPQFIKVVANDTFVTLLMSTAIQKDGKWVVNPTWAPVLPDYAEYVLVRKFD